MFFIVGLKNRTCAPILKELRHDILSHFFDGLNHALSVEKPKTNGLLMKEETKGAILK